MVMQRPDRGLNVDAERSWIYCCKLQGLPVARDTPPGTRDIDSIVLGQYK